MTNIVKKKIPTPKNIGADDKPWPVRVIQEYPANTIEDTIINDIKKK